MKKLKVLLLCLLFVFVSGCGHPKEVVEPEDYLAIAKELNFDVQDYTSSFAYSEASYLISTNNFYALYVKGKRQHDIEGLFLDECRNVYNVAEEGYKENTDGHDNWVSLEVKDNTYYYYVVYVEDTYLYIKTDVANESVAKNLVERLGY